MSGAAVSQTNYLVAVALYGRYPHGSVIPAAVPLAYGTDPAALVACGTLRPTADPCNCAVIQDEPPPPGDPVAELVAERNALRERAERAERALALAAAKAAGLEKDNRALQAGLARLAGEKAAADQKAADLEAELEQATAPAA